MKILNSRYSINKFKLEYKNSIFTMTHRITIDYSNDTYRTSQFHRQTKISRTIRTPLASRSPSQPFACIFMPVTSFIRIEAIKNPHPRKPVGFRTDDVPVCCIRHQRGRLLWLLDLLYFIQRRSSINGGSSQTATNRQFSNRHRTYCLSHTCFY